MVILLSDAWLSDFHIDSTLQKISHQYCGHYGAEASDHHILLPVFDIGSIVSAYRGHEECGDTTVKGRFLLEVENKIILGQVDSVGGVLHLPNHWTSLVIMFKQPRILYGDSLGSPMPSTEALSFQKWIAHMLRRSGSKIQNSQIPISPLDITVQQDSNSCGLLALNAISHHYFQQDSPLLQSDTWSMRNYRMKIALELLQENAVSILLSQSILYCSRTNDAK